MLAWLLLLLAVNSSNAKSTRISYSECKIDPGLRLDCGFRGITEEQCYRRECCYAETRAPDTPWCYHSESTVNKKCAVSDEERLECGSYGIRKEQCLSMGCCWQPSNGYDTPWCYHEKVLPIQTGQCGTPAHPPNVRSTSRIVGGIPAKRNSWPWQVSLQTDGFHFCGASIVNEYWVVSAAHCAGAFDYGGVEIVVGQHLLSERNSNMSQRIPFEKYIKHDDFSYDYGTNDLGGDIMLIKLQRPIQFTDEISPVCIPDQNQDPKPGTVCYATGWGSVMLGGDAPDELQQVQAPVLEQQTCVNWYADPQNWYSGGDAPAVTSQMICTGYEEGGRGTCHGDSGGPLVCYMDDAWHLSGVVSWGGPCAQERTPSVFARVSQFNEWMQKVISDHD